MRKKEGVILDWDCFGPEMKLEKLENLGVHWIVYPQSKPEEIKERLQGKEIAVVHKVSLSKEILTHAPELKLVCEGATGYDNIDVKAAKELGIAVCNVPSYSTDSVAELVLLFILSLFKRSFFYQNTQQTWPKSPLFCCFNGTIQEVKGKTIGIIGAGKIGQEVGRLCEAFGMKVIYSASRDPKKSLPGALPLEKILPIADLISLHLPLTKETFHLFGEKQFFSMKKGAFFINTCRGQIIDDLSLAKALKENHLGGAALDVLSQEPPSKEHPLLDPSIPHLLLTPHIGWASIEARERLVETVAENIRAYLRDC